jgi:UDP-glucose 4-epimerase
MIEKALKGEQLEVWGDPERAKDIVYVKDFNQMVIKAIASPSAQGVYNVATGVATTLDQQVRGIAEVFSPKDRPSAIVYRPDRPSQASYLYHISKAKRDLGYEPSYSYLDMLHDMRREMTGDRFKHLEKANVSLRYEHN